MSKIYMAVFTTKESEKRLEEMILKNSGQFTPMRTNNYTVTETGPGSFRFQEEGCEPFRSFGVRIKGGEIWSEIGCAHAVLFLLCKYLVIFTTWTRPYRNIKEANNAFKKAPWNEFKL